MQNLLEKQYQVRSYEVTPSGQAAVFSLLNYLQDAAGEHAAQLGVSVAELQQKGLTWVMSRYLIRFYDYPCLGDTIHVCTWPSSRDRLTTTRDFEMFDHNGQKLLKATTSVALLDLQRERPVKIEKFLPKFPILQRRVFSRETALPDELGKADLELSFHVRFGQLDLNQHVNNAVYAAWALETVPEEQSRTMQPEELEIAYRAPAKYGDIIRSRTLFFPHDDQIECLHQLVRQQDGRELVRLRSLWRPADAPHKSAR